MPANGTSSRIVLANWPLLALIPAFGIFYFFLAVHADTPLIDGDDAVYALMADYFSFASDRPRQIIDLVIRHTQFPPFYPLMLGLFGADSAHLWMAHLLTVGFLLASMLLLFLWARSVLPNTVSAALVVTIFGLLPTTVFQSFGILSENLYLLLSVAALLCLRRSDGDDRWAYVAALVAGLASVTRTAGITLLIAYLAHVMRLPRKQRPMLIFVAVLPLLIATAWKFTEGSRGSYLWSVLELAKNQSLLDLLFAHFRALPGELWSGWIMSFNHHPSSMTFVIGSMLGLFCFAGTIYRCVQQEPDGIYVLLYVGVIALWPWSYEARRFLYVVIPFFLVHGVLLVRALIRQSDQKISIVYPYMYFAAIGIVLAPAAAMISQRFVIAQKEEFRWYAVSPSWYGYDDIARAKLRIAEQKTLTAVWRQLQEKVPENQCIYHLKPIAFMMYSNRVSYATPLEKDHASFWREATLCRYFYLGSYVYSPYNEALYPRRYLPGAQVISRDYLEDYRDRRLLGLLVEVKTP
jgi:hypothetical protein